VRPVSRREQDRGSKSGPRPHLLPPGRTTPRTRLAPRPVAPGTRLGRCSQAARRPGLIAGPAGRLLRGCAPARRPSIAPPCTPATPLAQLARGATGKAGQTGTSRDHWHPVRLTNNAALRARSDRLGRACAAYRPGFFGETPNPLLLVITARHEAARQGFHSRPSTRHGNLSLTRPFTAPPRCH
jgi:hypothetical protein